MSSSRSVLALAWDVLALVSSALVATAWGAQTHRTDDPRVNPRSVHAVQGLEAAEELASVSDDERERVASPAGAAAWSPATGARLATAPALDELPYVVFGYLQSESQVFHTRWHALTHVGSLFVSFDSSGSLTGTSSFSGRSSYLQAGGAAQASGVRVILVVNNFDDAPGGAIETVMLDPARRAVLVAQIVALLEADDYVHGVSLDLEFSWGPGVRDGITAFFCELRDALDATGSVYESSVYVGAIHSASQWNFDAQDGVTPHVDYVLYSMYDWATGSVAHAISDFDACLGTGRLHGYLNAGLPPEKLVPVVSAYSRSWSNTSIYNGIGSSPSSSSFPDALYDVSLNPSFGGPYANTHVRGDEASWYAWDDGTPRTRTWEGLEGFAYEIRHALSLQDPAGTWSGRRLGGIGFWSLFWMAETSSFDPRTSTTVARTRTYPQVYQLCQEILRTPGAERFVLEAFEGLDFRWRDPNESPDSVGDSDGDSARTLIGAPIGAPQVSTNAMQLTFDFEAAGTNVAVLAHEVLASPLAPGVTDSNAMLGFVDATSAFEVELYLPAAVAGYELRLLLADADGELEASPPTALDGAGWRRVEWDLTAPGAVTAWSTLEPAFASGDGLLDSAGAESRDLGFYGFAVSGEGAVAASLVVDELAWRPRIPGKRYTINELRYADPSEEFVELFGPAGPLPTGLELHFYDSSDASLLASMPLMGSIEDEGDGTGFFVTGDPAVPGVDLSSSFAAGRDDLPDLDPSAMALIETGTGAVHDSLVWEAFGGLDDLIRVQARGVADRGGPWVGEVATGTDASERAYTIGRYPDGFDTRVNGADFSFQPASPGAPNGGSVAFGEFFDFESPPPRAFQTFESFRRFDPRAAGLWPSPNGGLAYRCVDSAGGGVIGVIGDAALSGGQRITGELYLPASNAQPQAVAVGAFGRQGSRFFSTTALARSGYESGLWLVYENAPGVALADGRADHPETFELLHVTHDAADGAIAELLGSLTLAEAGLPGGGGTWVAFSIELDPSRAKPLAVHIDDAELFRGSLPEDAPRAGAFQVGFRENHAGPPAADEGTWIDGLSIERVPPGFFVRSAPTQSPR